MGDGYRLFAICVAESACQLLSPVLVYAQNYTVGCAYVPLGLFHVLTPSLFRQHPHCLPHR